MLLHYLPVWLMRSLTETLMLGLKTAGFAFGIQHS
jgi:hypothetical protein